MPRLRLESASDAFDLNDISDSDFGVEALSGVTGLGLPPVQLQWLEGAGDGAVFRGSRIQPRDIDIPLFLRAPDRFSLQNLLSRVAKMLTSPMTLRFVEDDGSDWSLQVYRVGGGVYAYGVDTRGLDELRTIVTVRAGDPFWTYSVATQRVVGTSNAGRGLLKGTTSLSKLKLSGSSASGLILMENDGDVAAYPVWQITGPIAPVSPNPAFVATSQTGESFTWNGTLTAGQTLTIDARTASVVDGTGANRYGDLAAAPKFWTIPPGISQATISAQGTSSGTAITATWYPRKWAVV